MNKEKDLDVENILSEIIKSLLVECSGEENVTIKKNISILNESKSKCDIQSEGKLSDTEMVVSSQKSETSSDFYSHDQFREKIEKNTKLDKLSDGYDGASSSSGFEDLSPKVNGTITHKNFFDCPAKNDSNILSSRIVGSTKKISDEINRMITSTPINFSDKVEKIDELFVYEESNESEDPFLCDKDNEDYFNETIEKAINRYEKDEKKFNTVAVQTVNRFEMCVKCSSNSILILNEERDETLSPSKKKFKAMIKNSVKIKESIQKSIEIVDFDEDDDGFDSNKKEINVNIINKIPIKVTRGISTGGENFGFCKMPRIRVGLSKKIKPKKLSKY